MVNHVERAYRAWPILVNCAQNDAAPITYGALAAQLGIHPRAIRYVLGVIQDYCMSEGLPPITILVVSAATERPSSGFIACDMDDLERGRAEVSAFKWTDLENPFVYAADGTTENDLVDQLVGSPSAAHDVYARVKVRGMVQAVFRKTLLRVYKGKCAICGLTFEDALEAAHLIPWNEASPQERLDPANGLLLCATHHKLFDTGQITVTRSGRIEYCDPDGDQGPYSASDKSISLNLHGKRAILPAASSHRPSPQSLAHNHRLHEWGDLP